VVAEGAVRNVAGVRFEPLDLGGDGLDVHSHDFH
jgi:hypothetical protein